jgi:ATP-dependent DNA helicase PIF1
MPREAENRPSSRPSGKKRRRSDSGDDLPEGVAGDMCMELQPPNHSYAYPITPLSSEQQRAVDAAFKGHNIYIGGVSGSGKSLIVHSIRAGLQERGKLVAVMAFTGLAAALIHGSTIHSFFGIAMHLGPETEKGKVWDGVRKNRAAVFRLAQTDTFIFDELSYISSYHYTIYEEVARRAKGGKGRDIIWGGAQIVFLGDFKQLPPIGNYKRNEAPWLFLSPDWRKHVTHYFNLVTVVRQTDPELIKALNDIRHGEVSSETDRFFRRVSAQPPLEGAVAHLFPTIAAVDTHNEEQMARLPSKPTTYRAKTVEKNQESVLESAFAIPEEVCLKQGATVMLTKNLGDGLVNGTLGIVLGFCLSSSWNTVGGENQASDTPSLLSTGGDVITLRSRRDQILPIVRWTRPGSPTSMEPMIVRPYTFNMLDAEGNIILSRTQIPIMLAYAMTFHKAQGQTLTRCVVHLEHSIFHPGKVSFLEVRCRH